MEPAMKNYSDRQHNDSTREFRQDLRETAFHLECSVCHRDIPLSTSLWRESSDYVAHFCGLDCYDKWRQHGGET
jgi:hypothetical protein